MTCSPPEAIDGGDCLPAYSGVKERHTEPECNEKKSLSKRQRL